MGDKIKKRIKITHFAHPHLFWFKYDKVTIDDELKELEIKVKNYAVSDAGQNDKTKISVGHMVAVYMTEEQKWIRAKVGQIDEQNSNLILWATDYGHPIKTSPNLVAALHPSLQNVEPLGIVCGGIEGIVPQKRRFNSIKQAVRLTSREWSDETVSHIKALQSDSRVKFYFLPGTFSVEKRVFGSLEIKSTLKVRTFYDILIEGKYAIKTDNFAKVFDQFQTPGFDQWLQTTKNIDCVLNYGEIPVATTEPALHRSKLFSLTDRKRLAIEAINRASANKNSGTNDSAQCSQSTSQRLPMPNEDTTQTEGRIGAGTQLKKLQNHLAKTKMKADPVEKGPTQCNSSENRPLIAKTDEVDSTKKPVKSETNVKPNVEPSDSGIFLPGYESGLVNKIKLMRILAHCDEPLEEPVEVVANAKFVDSVNKIMKNKRWQEVYKSQAYAWPHLMRGNSLILIDSMYSGKTLAYLPALCSLVQYVSRDKETAGATAVIVCLSSCVKPLALLARLMLATRQDQREVIELNTNSQLSTAAVHLLSLNCKILVTTVPCLLQLIDKYPFIKEEFQAMNGSFRMIAFENIDLLLERDKDLCKNLMAQVCASKADMVARQIIVTSRTWHKEIPKFFNVSSSPLLLIGNYIEAARYANTKFEFQLGENKLEQLKEQLLGIPYDKERTLVVCNETDEVVKVTEFLKSKAIPSKAVLQLESNYDHMKIKGFWRKIEGVLVCSDDLLEDTNIKNVQHLIHYSAPKDVYKKFLNRFSTMLEYYRNALASNKVKQSQPNCIVFIDSYAQLPKMIELFEREGKSLPEEVLKFGRQARIQLDRDRSELYRFESVCDFLFRYARADHQIDCRNRHTILPFDVDGNRFSGINGLVVVKILKVVSPTEYIVWPIKAKLNGEYKRINQSDEYKTFSMKFIMHYKGATKPEVHHPIALGDIGLLFEDNLPHRCEIIKICESKSKILRTEESVDVKLIDSGEIRHVSASEIHVLDEQFRDFPRQAINMHLTGVVPLDLADDWDEKSVDRVRSYLDHLFSKEPLADIQVNVMFTLRNTFVVNMVRGIDLKYSIVHFSMQKYLIEKRMGKTAAKCREKVVELMKSHGVKFDAEVDKEEDEPPNNIQANDNSKPLGVHSTPVSGKLTHSHKSMDESKDLIEFSSNDLAEFLSDDEDEVEVNWTKLSSAEDESVMISTWFSPSDFYVQVKNDEAERFYQEIDKYVEEYMNNSGDKSIECPDIDQFCLVKYDDYYHRGKILDTFITPESLQLKVYAVDLGQTVTTSIENVIDIPKEFLDLKFQAIWCNMAGLKSKCADLKWDIEAGDQIYDEIDKHQDDLYVHIVSTREHQQSIRLLNDLPSYNVILYSVHEENAINLNGLMVTNDFASPDMDGDAALQWVPPLNNKVDKTVEKTTENYDEEDYAEWDSGSDTDGFFVNDIKKLTEGLFENNNNKTLPPASPTSNSQAPALPAIEEEPVVKKEGRCTDIGKVPKNTNKSHLIYEYERPMVQWQQSDEIVLLRISANDDTKYNLKITSQSLFFSAMINEKMKVLVINFFGSIEHRETVHNLAGLNVVVRLKKSCKILAWPRLTKADEKSPMIVQNFDAITIYEEYVHGSKAQFLRPNDDEKMEDAGFVGEYENPFDEIEKDLLEEEED